MMEAAKKMATSLCILPIRVLSDNIAYLIIDEASKSREAALVDPADGDKCLQSITDHKVKLTHVLTTHKHGDHSGGNSHIARRVPGVRIVGGPDDIPAVNMVVKDTDTFKIGNLDVRVLATPCHTTGHVTYLVNDGKSAGALFTGDTLFIAGCGRFFEGTAQQMLSSLGKLAQLPDDTLVFCGHEYTVSNLQFARAIEPDNEHVRQKLEWALERRKQGDLTVPSTIGQEKRINPFMRTHVDSIMRSVGKSDPVQVMQLLRDRKNAFRATL